MLLLLLKPSAYTSDGGGGDPVTPDTGGHFVGHDWNTIAKRAREHPKKKKPLRSYKRKALKTPEELPALEEIEDTKQLVTYQEDLDKASNELNELYDEQQRVLEAINQAMKTALDMARPALIAEGIQRQIEQRILAEQLAKEQQFLAEEQAKAKDKLEQLMDEEITAMLISKLF